MNQEATITRREEELLNYFETWWNQKGLDPSHPLYRRFREFAKLGADPDTVLHLCFLLAASNWVERQLTELKKQLVDRKSRWRKEFRALGQLGGELVSLHLLESRKLDKQISRFVGGHNPVVEKVSWSNKAVWVDKTQTTGFKGVSEEVWNFHIGGYQICEKWLKDRKGRTLSNKYITHYHKIVLALSETIRLMKEIDEVIHEHGGWPDAFQTETGD